MKLSPETHPTIWAAGPRASNGLVDTCGWICLKNAKGCLITVVEIGAGTTNLVLEHVHQGVVKGTQGTIPALTTGQEFPIWINLLTSTTDEMVRQTDALTYTISYSAIAKIVQFYISARKLSPGYSWIQLGSSGGNASNIVCVLYQLDGVRYKQATPPTAIA